MFFLSSASDGAQRRGREKEIDFDIEAIDITLAGKGRRGRKRGPRGQGGQEERWLLMIGRRNQSPQRPLGTRSVLT